MRRTLLVYPLPALVLAWAWLRLETPRPQAGQAHLVAALALAPALFGSRRLRALAGLAALLAAAQLAFQVSVFDARPFGGQHGFVAPLLDRFRDGFLAFYEFRLPVDPGQHPLMHGVLLAAVFGFCFGLGLAIAARRPGVAVVILVAGAGWPATLLAGGSELGRGALILAAALLLLAGLSERVAVGAAVPATAVVVAAAFAASSSPALAKSAFLNWQQWNVYTPADAPVSVQYVWSSNYGGIRFPKKVTTVLEIKAPPAPLYWRATVLDEFDGFGWVERLHPAQRPLQADPLVPKAARDRRRWVKEQVTVRALRDDHLVGGSVPVAYDSAGVPARYDHAVAVIPQGLVRDERYTVWSYAPAPTSTELAASPPDYPRALTWPGGELEVAPGLSAPAFGTRGRATALERILRTLAVVPALAPYQVLYQRARAVAGAAQNPYSAAVALESWFRTSGGFRYDERPPVSTGAPLVGFVAETKAGYCQYFAGAMALMLRYLGVPARVAAGFTSGTYDSGSGNWTVTDHDAHTWVEAWFSGYGWLPFDPTPGRGRLAAPYSVASPRFDAAAAAALLGGLARVIDPANYKQNLNFGERGATSQASGADVRRAARAHRGGGVVGSRSSLLRLLALLAAAAVAAIALAKSSLRRVRYASRDPRRVAAGCRRELAGFLADQRIEVSAGATLAELGRRAAEELGVEPDPFVRAATAARFGPRARAHDEAASARAELRQLLRMIRRRLTPLERARGLLSLRSLGFG